MSHREDLRTLVDQPVALREYLDALLREAQQAAIRDAQITVQPPEGVEATIEAPVKQLLGGVPEWAKGTFQCLVFEVAGLKLAVPVIKLSGVTDWPEQITKLPQKPAWYMGLVAYREGNSALIDTAKLVFPQGREPDANHRYDAVVFIGETHFGLACDRIDQVLTLEPEAVSWRGARSVRPWLAGTVRKEMCAILDVEEFVAMLRR